MKVSFDPITKIISVIETPVNGQVFIDVKADIYSDGKELWISDDSLTKFRFPVRAVGGDPLPGSKSLGSTFFLLYGWKIRPFEDNHTMNVNGNLYTDDGSTPYAPTIGTFNIMLISSVSSLVDSTIQQLPEIEHMAFEGMVHLNSVSGMPGIDYPIGTHRFPSDNYIDAKEIAIFRGFPGYHLAPTSYIFSNTDDLSGYFFRGSGVENTKIVLTQGCVTSKTTFEKLSVSGTQSGETHYESCEILELAGVHCKFTDCLLVGPMTMMEGTYNDTSVLANCYTGYNKSFVSPALKDEFVVNLNNSSINMAFNNFHGKIKFINLNRSSTAGTILLNIGSGKVTIDSSCTQGQIKIRGNAEVVNNSGGTVVDDDTTMNLILAADPSIYPSGSLAKKINDIPDETISVF